MRIILFALVLGLSSLAKADPKIPVDTLIVLAVDVSLSVDDKVSNPEYSLQKSGIATALRDPEVRSTLEQCNQRGVAITYVEWSGNPGIDDVRQIFGWRQITTGADLITLAHDIESIPKKTFENTTDIAAAIRSSVRFIAEAPFEGERKVIVISGDGPQNVNHQLIVKTTDQQHLDSVRRERDAAIESGHVIDGLAILNDMNMGARLEGYYRDNVVGGPQHVLVGVTDFSEYGRGLRTILLRELDHCAY